mgnify:CR=1 FL=1
MFTGTLLPYQVEAVERMCDRQSMLVAYDLGLGKTVLTISAIESLMDSSEITEPGLVICLSSLKYQWGKEIAKFSDSTFTVIDGTKSKREVDYLLGSANSKYVITNYESIVNDWDIVSEIDWGAIVCDEATAIKRDTTDRWKAINQIVTPNTWLWLMTGTPAAQSPLDAYGLAKLVNPDGVPKFFGTFRDMVMAKITQFKWVPKENATQTVFNALQPAIRFTKDECLDLPEMTYVKRNVELTKQQEKYYQLLKKRMVIQAAGEEISAVNAATQVNKLLQIACGSVYTDTGEVVDFDVSNRLNVVQEVIEESSNKVLVFVPFTHTIDLLRKHLEKNHITCDVINGSVSANARADIVNTFQSNDNVKVLIIQPQAASHGLTLTAADTIIWYAPCTSVETYLQANARIDRPGQKNSMTIVHVKGSNVESRMYALLRSNIHNHNQVIDLYRQEILEKDFEIA